ncbi:myoneurin [Biomphalaria pfeifferi]|uniref:Myoneurin n=1 Tax=Biomphalaria pfeifferi TaxID=112525 RepID=A0AAD8ASP1_BIOPF|nr:myoneurin [Biomphalaria pfeifferi]
MTSKGTESEWESTLDEDSECEAAASQGSRMRRGDISAKVTLEMRRMIHKAEKKGVANQEPFQSLAENCGFKVISEDDTSDCEREFESDFRSSDDNEDDGNSTASTTCTSCCYSDHALRGSRCNSYQVSGQPIDSASEISHSEKSSRKTRDAMQDSHLKGSSQPAKSWKVEAGKTVWERIDPVVDNLETPRDSSANHVTIEDSLPAKCKQKAIQSSGRSAFRPVIARSQGDPNVSDTSKTTETKYKIFMENTALSSQGNRTVGQRNTKNTMVSKQDQKEKMPARSIDVRPLGRDSANSDKEVEETFRITKKLKISANDQQRIQDSQLAENGRRSGGMIHRLREINERVLRIGNAKQPATCRTDKTKGAPNARRSTDYAQKTNSPEGFSSTARRRTSMQSDGPRRQTCDGQVSSTDSRRHRSEGQVAGHSNRAPNSAIDEMCTPLALPGTRMKDNTGSETMTADDKRHVDYRRNVNCNYEDADNGEEICASAFVGQYLYELWKNQCLCDVRIRVGKSSYLAHKIVLAAFSEVFCPNEPQKMPSLCFDVPHSTPDAVYQILLYLYTSEMELTDGILEEVLNAANFMGIWEVICLIKEILSKPTFDNFAVSSKPTFDNFALTSKPTFDNFALTSKPTFDNFAVTSKPTFDNFALTSKPTFDNFALTSKPTFDNFAVSSKPTFDNFALTSKPMFDNFALTSKPTFDNFALSSKPMYDNFVVSSKPMFDNFALSSKPTFDNFAVSSKPMFDNFAVSSKPMFDNFVVSSKPMFDNFALYLEIRERQGMSAGLLDFPDIVREHLLELTDTPHFLSLTIDELETLLRDPDIMVESEMDIVNVISKWIEYDPFHRMKCAARLLSLVNFECLSAETLFEIVEEKKHLFDMDAIQVLLEAFKCHALRAKDSCRMPPNRAQDYCRMGRPMGTNECSSNCESAFPVQEQVRTLETHVKTFKEIRDHFASQRQTEARRVMQRVNQAKQCVNSHAVPYDDTQPPFKGTGVASSAVPSSRSSGFNSAESPCQPKQCPIANDSVKAVREFHLSAAAPGMNVEGHANRCPELEQRASAERRSRNVSGQKPLSVGEYDEATMQSKPHPYLSNKGRHPDEYIAKNKSPSKSGWSNDCYPACKSPGPLWADREDELEYTGQQGRRLVRRRGDLIKPSLSPGDTTGSEKSSRKRVTFS